MTLSRKICFPITLLFIALAMLVAVPAYAISVDQDVTLQTSSGDDMTMLSGSAFDTLTVSGNTFTFTLSGSQSVTLRDTGTHIMKSNITGLNQTCEGGYSQIVFSASNGASVAITLEGFACSGGGGGGGSYTTPSTTTTDTDTTTTTSSTETATPVAVATGETATSESEPVYLEGAPPPAFPLSSAPSATSNVPPYPSFPVPTASYPGIADINRGLAVGSTGKDVTALQQALASMPDVYPEGLVTGYFGSLTKTAVQKFQMKYSIVSSAADSGYGYVGPMTRAKLRQVFGFGEGFYSPPLQSAKVLNPNWLSLELDPGDTGDDVTQLQAYLATDPSLYPEGLVTGYYGGLTTAAVKRFQAKYGISQVGRVGPQTMAKLNEVMGAPRPASSQPSESSSDPETRRALQQQINDLTQLMNSLMQQMEAAR